MESPLRPPPPGYVSNFDNPEFLGVPVVASAGLCIPLVCIFVAVRIYARVLVRKWTLQDYLFGFSCLVGIAFIAFSIPLTLAKPYGYHVWDIDTNELNKTSMLRLQTFAISTGPVLWITKVTLFFFLVHTFKASRWFRNSAYLGIIATGLIYSLYTCTVTIACAARPGSDVASYIAGFRRDACSSSRGINMAVSLTMGFVNSLTDLYLVTAALILNSSLNATAREMRGIYLIHFGGAIACVCGFLGVVYRIKSWEDADITGYQIPLNVAMIIEVALSLMIPCMPSFYTIWHHYTYIDINEQTTIGSPSTRLTSTLSHYPKSTPTPPPEAKASWRKTHMSVEELPFRKASSEFYRGSVLSPRDSRMKALPCTPLPFNVPMSPKTPNSVRSMQLPILLESPYD